MKVGITPSPRSSPLGADLCTHLTQGAKDVIRETCMFVANISLAPFWIGFKRRFERNLRFPDSICPEEFVNG